MNMLLPSFKEEKSLSSFTLKIEAAGSSETLIPIYKSIQHHIPGFKT
jgi:hypothetical protein